MKLYTIGEAALILEMKQLTLVAYCREAKVQLMYNADFEDPAYIASTDLEKIREARRYRPL